MADVVGYSRLMAVDEEGTVAKLKANRKDLIIPKQKEYKGRTVKLMGDGALMEFGSVVDAVNFAIDVQRANKKRNEDVSTACGSLTFTIISARSKISAAVSIISAPARRYSSSLQLMPIPAFDSINT